MSPIPTASPGLGGPTPHLAVVVLENKEFGTVVGSPDAPFLNHVLLPRGRLFTRYHAVTHPSLPNYLVMTSGGFGSCTSDGCPRGSDPRENLFHQMNTASPPVSWKAYVEDMPSSCYPRDSGAYVVHHNPPPYFSDLGSGGDGSCAKLDVPYPELAADLGRGTLPRFAFVVPNRYDDMHSDRRAEPCLLGSAVRDEICQGDRWLQANLPPLLSDGGRGDVTVILVFDEGTTGEGGGGRVVMVEIGPNVCSGCTSAHPFDHYGLVAAIDDWFGLPRLTGAAPSR